jgi:5-methylcytosine-specific restriction endonuclease McrA
VSHACVISETFAAGLGRCSCGQWWAATPPQHLVRRELRERLEYFKRRIDRHQFRDLREAVKWAAAQQRRRRAREHFSARGKWRSLLSAKQGRYWRYIRPIIMASGPCAYCGAEATAIDHIFPRIRGGTDERHNLAPVCKSCNTAKGGRTPEEWKAARMARGLPWPPVWEKKAAA